MACGFTGRSIPGGHGRLLCRSSYPGTARFPHPLPPACSPELPDTDAPADSLDGTQCPANKLVITPSAPIRGGATFTV
ncbi:MAG TPA: hypothetical protein VH589_26330, partial [Trebonia sp.]